MLLVPLLVDVRENSGVTVAALLGITAINCVSGWVMSLLRGLLITGVCWTFFLIFLVVAPLVQLASEDLPWPQAADTEATTRASLVLALSSTAMSIASFFWSRAKPHPDGHLAESHTVQHRHALVLPLLISLTIMCLCGYTVSRIGASTFLSTRVEFDSVSVMAFGSQTNVSVVLGVTLGGSLFTACYWLAEWNRFRGKLRSTMACVACFVAIFMSNPLANPRYWAWAAYGAMVFVGVKFSVRLTRALFIGAPAALIVLFPVLDYFRSKATAHQSTTLGSVSSMATNPDYDAFQMLTNVVAFTDNRGLQHGKQLLGVLLLFVPRSMWASKPEPTSSFVAKQLGYTFTNLSSPLPSEGYVDFGLVGAIVYCVVWISICLRLDHALKSQGVRSISPSSQALIAILALYQFVLLRGSLIGTAYFLFPLFLLWVLFRRRHLARVRTLGIQSSRW